MKRTYLLRVCLPVVISVAAVVLVSCRPSSQDMAQFQGTTNIVFIERGSGQMDKAFRISDTNEVERLLVKVRLRSKEPCACGHAYEAVFQKPSAEIRVSFCDHCFDILADSDPESYRGAHLYAMPKDFFAAFQQLAKTSSYERWSGPRPPLP